MYTNAYYEDMLKIAKFEKTLYDIWFEGSLLWWENMYKKYWSVESVFEKLTEPIAPWSKTF